MSFIESIAIATKLDILWTSLPLVPPSQRQKPFAMPKTSASKKVPVTSKLFPTAPRWQRSPTRSSPTNSIFQPMGGHRSSLCCIIIFATCLWFYRHTSLLALQLYRFVSSCAIWAKPSWASGCESELFPAKYRKEEKSSSLPSTDLIMELITTSTFLFVWLYLLLFTFSQKNNNTQLK